MSTLAELPGWTRRVSRRKSGYSAGRSNVYYYSPNGMKFRSKPEISRTLGNSIDLTKFDFKARNRSEETPTYSHLITRRSPPKNLEFRKESQPIAKVQNRIVTVKSPRRSPRNIPQEETAKSPLSTLSPSLKKASMMKPLRQTCGVMRLPIEYVRPDHTNSDDIMPEKLLQNGLFQGHWDNRLKSFYPVDGKTGEIVTPPAPNPIQTSIIIQPTPVQADSIQAQVIPAQANSLPPAPLLNKIGSPPAPGSALFQPARIHHPTQGPFSLNLVSSGLAPNLLSNTNHNLSPATVNQLHALLLKSPAKTEPEQPQAQPNCTTLQQPRLPKPIPSKPGSIIQNKPSANPLYILQTQVPQNLQVGIGQRAQQHNYIQATAAPSSGTNLIQIVSNQSQGKTAGNKVLLNNPSGLSRQEVLLLNPNTIGNPNNSQQPHIKLTRTNATNPIINRPIIHQTSSSTITTSSTTTTATPINSQHQSDISQDNIRKQQLRIEQLKKQLLDAENTQTS